MGLPLFVAPVESDLPNKTTSKSGTAADHRVPSRHPSRSEIRDRRSTVRRQGVRIYNPAQRPQPRSARERFLPWVESAIARDTGGSNDSDRSSPLFREALREVTGADERGGERLEERMHSIFGINWTDSPSTSHRENMSEGVDLDWTSTEAANNRPARNSAAPSGTTRFWATALDGVADGTRIPGVDIPSPRILARYPGVGTPPHLPEGSRPERRRTPSPVVRSLSARQAMVPGRPYEVALDGLGDRERSLSPEVWDTLLSTLTPDPQAPSTGSSFASVAGLHSQSSGPSSTTPVSAPDLAEEVAAGEPPCESGCENSDGEDGGDYHPDYHRIMRRRREELGMAAPSSASARNRDGAPNRLHAGRSSGISSSGRTARQVRTANGPLTIYESTARPGQSGGTGRVARVTSTSNNARQRMSWLSPLVQEGEISSRASRNNPMAAEDDWAGMQRIVRSLARREDIPEEWWAEAGLSRTLGQSDAPSGNDSIVPQ